MNTAHPYDLIIGLDRSDKKADLYLIDPHTGPTGRQVIDTSPEALHDWLAQLREQHPEAKVAICLEQPAASVILFLETYSWITLYAINPITLQKFREAFVTSRAKDDGKDAQYLAELLLTHHAKLKPWQPDDAPTRQLQQLVSHRRAVIDERTGLSNRLKALLKQYFPQALALCGEDLWRPLATAFLRQWPTLPALQKAKPGKIKQFYYLHGSRSQKRIAERLALIEKAVALTDEVAVVQSHTLRVQLICRQLELLQKTIAEFDEQIAAVFQAHEDRPIFESFPGAGPVLAPRLLASLGSERERFARAENLQCFSGIAPVTKQSGGKCYIHRRYCCPKFLKQTFHEYAKESVLWSRWAAAFYLQQRQKGSSHHTAVRALAYKWQRIIWKCWHSRTPYKEETYEAVLKKNRSPLVALFDQIELGKSPVKKT
ncbi:MAG TPA: IS110 family transposase [Verrucomicrobiae bacterium]|nr:IS110 family transposase [Verrucomicrobiae bacterium]